MTRSDIVNGIAKNKHVPDGQYDIHMDMSIFASNVFTDQIMSSRISKATYKAYKMAVKASRPLDMLVADVIANAIKDWAISKGATHFTHWFQPIHIATAQKHESFVTPKTTDDCIALFEFTGQQLLRGEPDASSFPNGGIRSTSQARGYTTWDPTSPPFIRDNIGSAPVLYIPTCFCSWTGSALDLKTPLLRSSHAISSEATRLLRLLGDNQIESVSTSLGAEQEFFLIDREFFLSRPDLFFSGRTVIGANPPKGQELDDHYFAIPPPRALAFMQDVDIELWKLGIPSRTRHNEVAPSQYEMVPMFETTNLAADHNMIIMDVLNTVAVKHGLAVILHEKPFANVNGSGKHNNWSMLTNYGRNLLEPSKSPRNNIVFQVFLSCILRSIDLHGDLLRASVATPSNDWRLGMTEAPPTIMSVYLGSDIMELVNWLITYNPDQDNPHDVEPFADSLSILHIAPSAVAPFKRDRTDRNRTSPFAFTGNKFEFRSPGSSQSIAHTATILNTIIADSIRAFANELESNLNNESVLKVVIHNIIKKFITNHQRIIFEGDGYSKDWPTEAARRGLPNYPECVVSLAEFPSAKNIDLFKSLKVLSHDEVIARYNIYLRHYINTNLIEANCAINLIKTHVIPAALRYQLLLRQSIPSPNFDSTLPKQFHPGSYQAKFANTFSLLIDQLMINSDSLESTMSDCVTHHDPNYLHTASIWCRDRIKPLMVEIRKISDKIEGYVSDDLWTLPKYSEILFLK